MSKILKDMKFDNILNNRVDMDRVELEKIKPWISKRITGLIKHEDEVLIEYIYNQLEPKYPDPKEMQVNLSGFLSVSDARIFIAELWNELINSMESTFGLQNTNKNTANDKIKSFPRLGPNENRQYIHENRQDKSLEKNMFQKNTRNNRSISSESEGSISDEYDRRKRARSYSKYSEHSHKRYRYRNRSRTKSSSRYTPYTRYSRYTDSYCSQSRSSSSKSNDRENTNSYSTSSSSSISPTRRTNGINYDHKIKEYEDRPYSRNEQSKSPSAPNNDDYDHKTNLSSLDHNSEMEIEFQQSSKVDSNNHQISRRSIISSVDSISFVSEGNSSQRSPSSSSSSSSSDYSIEFVDKAILLQSRQYSTDEESESEVEWITMEEYEKRQINYKTSCSSESSSQSTTSSSSDYLSSDIDWIEEYQWNHFSDDFDRI